MQKKTRQVLKCILPYLQRYEQDLQERLRWKAHGINMLASSWETGTWTPVFEDLSSLSDKGIQDKAIATHYREEGGWSNPAIASWVLEDPDEGTLKESFIFTLFSIAQHRRLDHDDPFKPHDPITWKIFHDVKSTHGVES